MQIVNLTTNEMNQSIKRMSRMNQVIEKGPSPEVDSVKKSMIKTMSWRIVATTTTFVISWVVTGSVVAGGAIASIEFWAKLALYYAHERAWARAY